MNKAKQRRIKRKLTIFIALFCMAVNENMSQASILDGVLDTSIGNAGYVDMPNTLESWTGLEKLNDGNYLQFGSRRTNYDGGSSCKRYLPSPVLAIINNRGQYIQENVGQDAIEKLAPHELSYFISAIQDKTGAIYVSGLIGDVRQVNNPEGGFNCFQENRRSFIMKLTPSRSADYRFGAQYQSPGQASDGILYLDEVLDGSSKFEYVSSLSMFTDKVLAAAGYGNSSTDIVFLNSQDGSIEKKYGSSGKVVLNNPNFNIHKLKKVDSGLIVTGDIFNPNNDSWYVRWGITFLNQKGIENLNFRGENDFQYSSGRKEGFYVSPVYKAPFTYFIAGVLNESIYDIKAMRMDLNGKVDHSYGGYLREQLKSIGVDPCSYCSGEFDIDSSGRILISVGTDSFSASGSRKSVMVRLTQDGRIDKSFGVDGKFWIDFDYQAGVYSIDNERYVIYGTQYSVTNCSPDGKECGLNQSRLAQFTQLKFSGKRN